MSEYRRSYCGLCHPRCGLLLEFDTDFVQRWTTGFEDLKAASAGYILQPGKRKLAAQRSALPGQG